MKTVPGSVTHIVIPDTQAKPGVPSDHMRWIGQYIVDHFGGRDGVKIIHLGDHADMPSLSQYDRGKRAMEGRRYVDDIEAANRSWALLNAPIDGFNAEQRRMHKRIWEPEKHITLGNHEDRITRATQADATLEGQLSLDELDYARTGWEVHPFLRPLFLDGIGYVHYWTNHMTGKPIGGMIETMLKTIGHSFVMGHVQTLRTGSLDRIDADTGLPTRHRGIVAGAAYLHEEDYKGYQGNGHWRGILILHQVERGNYNLMEVDLEYLCRRYENKTLNDFLKPYRASISRG